jgi:hypothetical protein
VTYRERRAALWSATRRWCAITVDEVRSFAITGANNPALQPNTRKPVQLLAGCPALCFAQ